MDASIMLGKLIAGMGVSIQIFVMTLVFSLPLGLAVAFGRMSKHPVLRLAVQTYISIMRGTPLMLQLMVVYFGPYYLLGIQVGSGYRIWADDDRVCHQLCGVFCGDLPGRHPVHAGRAIRGCGAAGI